MSHEVFEQALTMVSVDWVTLDRRYPVRLDRVLYTAWKPSRLERCREKLAQGLTAPAIKLVGLKLGSETWYSVTDGMHRCAARAEAGKTHINALVSGYHVCDPSSFILWRGDVWREASDGARQWVWEPTPDTVPVLRKIGVRDVE
jgi:hypothetical protein